MLNRRALRIKAMQGLFTYLRSRNAIENLSELHLGKHFEPDLDSMEPMPEDERMANKAVALQAFEKINLRAKDLRQEFHTHLPENIHAREALVDTLNFLTSSLVKEKTLVKNQMNNDVKQIEKWTFYLLKILICLRDRAHRIQNEPKLLEENRYPYDLFNFIHNPIFLKLEEEKIINDQNIEEELHKELRKVFQEEILYEEFFINYLKKKDLEWLDQLGLVQEIFKSKIIKNERLSSFFETMDLNWFFNKTVCRSLVLKALKSLDSFDSPLQIPSISPNWDEDFEFFLKLFNESMEKVDDELLYLSEKIKNWDVDRLAETDKIILVMAITEMKKFPSIPIKVTINEFVEMAKHYSTPKSKQFVNGVLEVVSQDLRKKGEILKSGRGLLDNQS